MHVQTAWGGQSSWTGEACSNTTWQGVICSNGRVTAVNLAGTGAGGFLDGFGQLTALSELRLAGNNFTGVFCTSVIQNSR